MKRCFFTFTLLAAFLALPQAVHSAEVTVVDRQLHVDGEPFFIKGVGYSPTPIGHFIADELPVWGPNDFWYVGPLPLAYPEQRFSLDSPDAVFDDDPTNGFFDYYKDIDLLERDFPLLQAMNANTIRTWGNPSSELKQKANEYGLKIMAGYWVDFNTDYTFPGPNGPAERQAVIDGFVDFVNTHKDDPSILMWGLSNENNLHFCSFANQNPACGDVQACDMQEQAEGYFQLMNDMAAAAKAAEGESAHPVAIVMANFINVLVTDPSTGITANYAEGLIPAVDLIGFNSYSGESFDGYPPGTPNLFDRFDMHFPDHGMFLAEFGSDAWNSCAGLTPEECIVNGVPQIDPDAGQEDEASQAHYLLSAWSEIEAYSVENGGPSNGGYVFHYTDDWKGYQPTHAIDPDDPCDDWTSSNWTPSVATHDTHFLNPVYFGFGVAEDNLVNPEWWGIAALERNTDGTVCGTAAGVDCVNPRQAYYDFACAWDDGDNLPPSVTIKGLADGVYTIKINSSGENGGTLKEFATATDPNGECDSLDFELIGEPTGVKLRPGNDENSRKLFSSNNTELGAYPVTLRVSDGVNPPVEVSFDLKIDQCFIATASYGSPTHQKIDTLRAFRDHSLLPTSLGEKFVSWYYKTSPELAGEISDRRWTRHAFRSVLAPIVNLAEWWMK